ncbi:MAG: hypothetical protein KGQ59_10350, partial [Bdellovibrionales bacterium]|nr:hypothetical protein [Bdellovibrionales bacterium]
MSRLIQLLATTWIFCAVAFSLENPRQVDPSPTPTVAVTAPVFMMERYFSSTQSQTKDPPTRVGDIIRFRWVGTVLPPASAVDIVVQEEGKSLSEFGWEVFSHPKDDRSSAFSLIPIRPGSLKLPILSVRDAEKKVLGVTVALEMEVLPAATPEELAKKPPDFLPPVKMTLPWVWIWSIVISVFLILIISTYVIWRLMRRYRRRKLDKDAKTVGSTLTEDEQALRALDKLEKDRVWSAQQFKPHYFGVSDVLKKYIERRFMFAATDCTTREMLQALQERGLDPKRIS